MKRTGTVLGLDIGRAAVKAVLADRRNPLRVLRCESLSLPATGDRASIVRTWLEKLGLIRCPCMLSLPGANALFQPIRLDPDDPRSLEAAAAIEVLKFNEIASEQMVYDVVPVAVVEGEKRFLLAMARPSVLSDTVGFAQEIGLNVREVVPSPVAMVNGLVAADAPSSEPCLFLDIGQSATQVAIGAGRQLYFARAFAGGGQMFTDALARAAKMPYAEAENAKIGKGGLTADDETTANGLKTAAANWLHEVQSCLSLHASVTPEENAQPRRVVLCGGGAALCGLAAAVQERLGMPAEVGSPVVESKRLTPGPEFAVAAGLVRAGSPAAALRLSLLPNAMREELLFREQKPFWIAAGVAAALILGVSLGGGYYDQHRRERHLRAQQQKLTRLQELVNTIQSQRAVNESLQALARPIVNLVEGGTTMRELITLVAESKNTNDWLTLVCDDDIYFHGLPHVPEDGDKLPKPVRKPPPGSVIDTLARFDRVIVEGYTPDTSLSSVKALIGKLEAAPFIASVDLLSDDQRQARVGVRANTGRGDARPFSIDIRLRQP